MFGARIFHHNFTWYTTGTATILSAIALGSLSGLIFVVGAIILPILLLLQLRHLLNRNQLLESQIEMSKKEICRSHDLATIDELSAGIAHEINNPLGIISQETQWMEHLLKSDSMKHLKEAEDLGDSLREISNQVDRCKEIVQKLLNLAREMEPVIQCVDVNDLVMNMADLVAKEAVQRNIVVSRDLQKDLPMIYSDPPLLRQVILNLLINAVHAINEEGRIIVTTRSRGDHVEITVADSGCGIPKENLSKIFTPFFSTKGPGKGTGLGLAICRGIIERLGGHISVSSEIGKWTFFTVHLPIDAAQAKEIA